MDATAMEAPVRAEEMAMSSVNPRRPFTST
jgi:hypothetical protein